MTLEHLDTVISFVVIIAGVSLLITTLTQMVSALLGSRGSNLQWGIKTLLTSLDPELARHADRISQEVLHHPLISDSTFSAFEHGLFRRWKLASAIRKDELIEILGMLARPRSGPPAEKGGETWEVALGRSLGNLRPPDVEDVLRAAPEIKKLLPDDPARADQVTARMTAPARGMSESLDRWFGSVMDRVSQRFALHMRLWTVLFAVLVAFALHLDAFRLLQQLSADAELRARLVASTDALNRKADEILVTSTRAPAGVYVQAMNQLIRAHRDVLQPVGEPGGFGDLDGANRWLSERLSAAGIAGTDRWLQEYQALVPQAALRHAADSLHSILEEKLTLRLIPDPYPRSLSSYWTPSWLHFWGIVASAALLSLGAPFWFSLLKTLSNLRPVVAQKAQPESAAGKADA
jgi:hypothetical protein